MPNYYVRKPIVVEAYQVGSVNIYPDWLHDAISRDRVVTYGGTGWDVPFSSAAVRTLQGLVTAYKGDWLVRDAKGCLTICKPHVFADTYDKAE